MSNRQPAGISKPKLEFITGQQVAARQGVGKGKGKEAAQKIEDGLCVDRDLKGKELATYSIGDGRCE